MGQVVQMLQENEVAVIFAIEQTRLETYRVCYMCNVHVHVCILIILYERHLQYTCYSCSSQVFYSPCSNTTQISNLLQDISFLGISRCVHVCACI